jgi:PAS domain S-box-containing protein
VGEPHRDAIIADLERRLEASERAARTLTDSERLYRSLFEGTATAVTLRSIDTQSFIDCNQAALRIYRARSVEQLLGSSVLDLSAEKQPDGTPSPAALRKHVGRAIETGFEHCEWLARRLDGTPFIADIRIAVLRLEDGRQIMQTIIEDITERKAAEALLQRRAERDEVIARISRRFLDDDLDEATRFAIDSLAVFFRADAKAVARWVETTAAPESGEAETEDIALVRLTAEMIAMARARRQAQEALRVSEERYRTVVERSHDTIVIFGLDAKLTFVSPAGERLLGYTAEELVGMSLADLIASEQHHRLPGTIADTRAGLFQSPTEWVVIR